MFPSVRLSFVYLIIFDLTGKSDGNTLIIRFVRVYDNYTEQSKWILVERVVVNTRVR